MGVLKVWNQSEDQSATNSIFSPILSNTGIQTEVYGRVHDFDEIPIRQDDLLLVMGEPLVTLLKNKNIVPKTLGIGKLREQVFPYKNGNIMLTYAPEIIYINPRHTPEVHWDARLAIRYLTTGTLKPKVGKYLWVNDFSEVCKSVSNKYKKYGNPVPVAFDLETIGLDPYAPDARILSVSCTIQKGQSFVYRVPEDGMPAKEILEQLSRICTSPKIKMVGANLKFDSHWTDKTWGIRITNQKFDTMLVGSLLNENMANSLNTHAKMHTRMGGYDSDLNQRFDKSRMDLALENDPETFLTYAGGDTDACLQVYDAQRKELVKDPHLAGFYIRLVQPVSDAFTVMERRGVVVNRDRYESLRVEVLERHGELHKKLIQMLPRKLRIKYRNDLKITRPAIIRDLFFTQKGYGLSPEMHTPKGEISTAMAHLKKFANDERAAPFIKTLKRFNSAQKTLSTYIDGFMKFIRSDGRFHPTYYLGTTGDGGATSGRSSCVDPAYQTIPKHTEWAAPLRSVYTAPEGHAILKLDFSQGELRVAACVANERTMIAVYRQGIDLHLKTGASINRFDLDKALELQSSDNPSDKKKISRVRQSGKIGNFGLLYGMSAAGLVDFASNAYDVHMPLSEAEQFKQVFFQTYPELRKWHKKYSDWARKEKMVRSPLGRIRHLPLANSKNEEMRASMARKAINSPIQSTLSDMCELSIALLYQQYPDLWVFGFTHDEIQCYVPEDDVELWASRIRTVMENLPFDKFNWNPQLKFVVDAEWSSENLSKCKPL